MWQFLEFFDVRWPWPLTLFNLKLAALHLLVAWGTFIPILIFLRFCLRVTSPYWTDGQRTARCAMRPIGGPHNKYLVRCIVIASESFTTYCPSLVALAPRSYSLQHSDFWFHSLRSLWHPLYQQQQQPNRSCYQLNNTADATCGRRSANWVLNNKCPQIVPCCPSRSSDRRRWDVSVAYSDLSTRTTW